MSGATPDPLGPSRENDGLARLKLSEALQRAKFAIAWERVWPPLARLLTVIGLFLVVSWAGLWLALPFLARAIGIGFFALSWCWSLVTSFSLLREASRVSLESLESFAANQIKMDEARIILSLSALPDWKREGQIISRTFEFADFVAAMKFVNVVGDLAEQAQHHPDIDIRWNKVTLALTTHDAGGLTEKDFALARQCDSLAAVR